MSAIGRLWPNDFSAQRQLSPVTSSKPDGLKSTPDRRSADRFARDLRDSRLSGFEQGSRPDENDQFLSFRQIVIILETGHSFTWHVGRRMTKSGGLRSFLISARTALLPLKRASRQSRHRRRKSPEGARYSNRPPDRRKFRRARSDDSTRSALQFGCLG